MEIKKFSEFSTAELTALWNEGFKGYAMDMTMSVDAFVKRNSDNQLSMEASIALCDNGKPVGFVMSGFRTVDGRLTAWNGGTGIIPEYRGKGHGKELIGAALDLYNEKGAEIALLEALSENEPAIKLYSKMGYQLIDQLRFYEQKEGLRPDVFAGDAASSYQFRFGIPQDIQRLNIPVGNMPWQTQWENIVNGESVIALDAQGQVVGFALFKRVFDSCGEHSSTALYQCRTVKATEEEVDVLLKALLTQVYAPLDKKVVRRTINLPLSEQVLVRILEEAGFTPWINQVHMKYMLND
ncbi:GNAT family N-acetyltransferase [Paenibacillus sp. KQZ6P-2]|uniref:GNAT family N-acetyltransferase n=1 Tax=Paenibacillus mangrovi TaxID=2931978 RepID=A0A9X1WTM3_9BACL|nr:GNAT family N-acetyltransferase [Paenibacillus mangrovi]MCJ8014859.1 GNAT family N-acetyltransferase [Paenibacillus mangrovi]